MFKEEIRDIELYFFCDSSLQTFASVIYLCVVTNTDAKVNLICGKTKVAPVKDILLLLSKSSYRVFFNEIIRICYEWINFLFDKYVLLV